MFADLVNIKYLILESSYLAINGFTRQIIKVIMATVVCWFIID